MYIHTYQLLIYNGHVSIQDQTYNQSVLRMGLKGSICPLFSQWQCTKSHPSMIWRSSPARAAAPPPRVGARLLSWTEAKPWASTSPRNAEPTTGADTTKPYLQQSVNPSWSFSLFKDSLQWQNHTKHKHHCLSTLPFLFGLFFWYINR